jgi:hypothetical protein
MEILPWLEDKIIAAMPWGMRDSWKNPHPLLEEGERSFHRGITKTFLKKEFQTLFDDFEDLAPPIPVRIFRMNPAEHVAKLAEWRQKLAEVPQRREAFFNQRITTANKIMGKALIIDKAVRAKARKDKMAKQKNRELRKQFFLERVALELPDVATDAVLRNDAFNAAIKIGRDGGSQRSWALLKTKISKDWENNSERRKQIARNSDAIDEGRMALRRHCQ